MNDFSHLAGLREGRLSRYRKFVNHLAKMTALFVPIFFLLLAFSLGGCLEANLGFVALTQAMSASTSTLASASATRAETLFRQAMAMKTDNTTSVWRGLGFALATQGREEEAIEAWRRSDDTARVLVYHGWHAQSLGKLEEAIYWYECASRLDSQVTNEWLYEIGIAYRGIKDLESALRVFRKASELSPENRNVWYQLGLIYSWRGEAQSALEAWQQGLTTATKGSIGESNLYYQIGRLKQRSPHPDLASAWEAYEQAIVIDNFGYERWQKADTYFRRGVILASKQEWEEAIVEYKLALKFDPKHYWAYLGLATALWETDQQEEAKTFLRRAIDLQPNRKNAYQQLGEYYQAEGNQTEARVMFLKVLRIDQNDRRAQKSLADLEHRKSVP